VRLEESAGNWKIVNNPSDVQEGKERWCGKMIGDEAYMKDDEASVPENLQAECIRLMKRQAFTDAVIDGFLPLGRLEASRVMQILSAFSYRFLVPNSC